jgi:hypothetical protein
MARINRRTAGFVTAMSADCHFWLFDRDTNQDGTPVRASFAFVPQGEADERLLFEVVRFGGAGCRTGCR